MKRRHTFLALWFLGVGESEGRGHKASLLGSPASQIRQNEEADKHNLTRIEDDMELEFFTYAGILVSLEGIPGVVVDPRLRERFRFVRPWVRDFLIVLGKEFRLKFGVNLQINSAVRTAEYQRVLKGWNGNAAPTAGMKRSSHLTGATVDIAKLTLDVAQVEWLRNHFLTLEERGIVEATEEHTQSVFHVMVLKPS